MLVMIGLLVVACSESAGTQPDTTTDWLDYENSSFGLSFLYPQSMNIRLDMPDTSGIQLQDDGLALVILANPLTTDSVETYASQLLRTGFDEQRRTQVSKGAWRGLRLEGMASSNGLEFPELLYLIKSGDSLLTLTAIWDEPPAKYDVVETLWESLRLHSDDFPLSSTLLREGDFASYSSPDGKFRLRYPSRWQAGALSETSTYITDPNDRNSFLLSIQWREGPGANIDVVAERALAPILVGF